MDGADEHCDDDEDSDDHQETKEDDGCDTELEPGPSLGLTGLQAAEVLLRRIEGVGEGVCLVRRLMPVSLSHEGNWNCRHGGNNFSLTLVSKGREEMHSYLVLHTYCSYSVLSVLVFVMISDLTRFLIEEK